MTTQPPAGVTRRACKNCGGHNLKWQAHPVNLGGAQDGRIRMSEVAVRFFLGCDDCSETNATADDLLSDHTAALAAKEAELALAVAALESNGFTRCPGPLAWKPPVNEAAGANWRKLLDTEADRDRLAAENARLREQVESTALSRNVASQNLVEVTAENARLTASEKVAREALRETLETLDYEGDIANQANKNERHQGWAAAHAETAHWIRADIRLAHLIAPQPETKGGGES